MSNQLAIGGAQPDKPTRYGCLFVSQIFTGYYPNRSQFRDAATSYVYQKFYSATRNDSILDGLNCELSPRMTLVRRPGLSIFDSGSYTNVQQFFCFKPFVSGAAQQIIVLADTPTAVYTTNPKTLLFTKSAGAGKTRFLQTQNTLLLANGVDLKKWSWFPAWLKNTQYAIGQSILDSNNNIQQSLGTAVSMTSTSVSSNVLTINFSGSATIGVGDVVYVVGATTKPNLNLANITVLSVGAGTLTAAFTTGNYTTIAESGILVDVTAGPGTSGSVFPSFSGAVQSVLSDGTNGWICRGNAVQNWGITAPNSAPTVANTPVPTGNSWAANTYYWPAPLIFDSGTTSIQLLTTSGTTAGSPPTFSGTSGVTTTDGTAIWTSQGTATRGTTTAYVSGQYILASWVYTYQKLTGVHINPNPPHQVTFTYQYITLNYSYFFQCTVGGTTSSTSTGSIAWNPVLNGTTLDGTVTWRNVGIEVVRSSSATLASSVNTSSGTVSGNVTNSYLVTTNTSIVSGGNGQTVVQAGFSGGSAPTFSTTTGGTTLDGTSPCLTWSCTGPTGAAQTAAWVYAFSFVNPATGDESNASPLSSAIVLAANSAITISGPGSSDNQVGQINIYRSTEGQVVPFFLASIPAPANGASWSYQDNTLDPPNIGATLNVLITAAGYHVQNGIVTNNNLPPTAGGTIPVYHAGRVWIAVGNVVYYSQGPNITVGNPNTSFDPQNFFQFSGQVNRLWPTTNGIYFFTTDGTWLITGLGITSNPFSQPLLVDDHISLLSPDAFALDGAQALAYSSDRQFYSIDATNGTSAVGIPIGNILPASYDPTQVYVTWHSNGLDQRGFITNGSNTWANFMLLPSPETGFAWSPQATLVNSGGVACIDSVETAANGTFSLLVGPSGTGPILKRDLTNFTDNGTAYNANNVFGLIQLAQYGQMAGVAFIGIDALKVGTTPSISVLLDEYYGQSTTPSFSNLGIPNADPPKLGPSNTLFNLRYWMIESQKPCWCRFMAVKIDFGNDTVQNELFQFGLYGKWSSER